MAYHDVVHLRQSLVGQLHQGAQLLVEHGRKVVSRLVAALDGAGQLETRVAYRLQLAHLAHQLAHLLLRHVAQVVGAHLLQEVGNAQLHLVGHVLAPRNVVINLVSLVVVFLVQHLAHLAKHLLNVLRIVCRLLHGLQHGYFGRLYQVGMNILQLALLLGSFLLAFCRCRRRQQPAHHPFQLRDEAYEQGGVCDVEAGVEGGQHHGQQGGLSGCRGVVAHQRADHVDERIEHAEHPNHAKDVEQQVGQCRPPSLHVGSQGRQVGRGRGANVFAHHQGNAQIDGQHARGAEQDGDGHHRRRRLHDAGNDRADGEEGEYGPVAVGVERSKEGHHSLVVLQVKLFAGGAQHHQRQEHEGYAKEEIAHVAVLFPIDEHHAEEEGRIDDVRQVHIVAQRHDPCRERGADVGTHNDGNGLPQREQTSRHEGYRHHRCGR